MNKANKGKAIAHGQGRAAGRQKSGHDISIWKRIPLWAYISAFLVGVLILGLPLYLGQGGSSPETSSSGEGVTAVGEMAPGFSLQDPYGQTYTLTPGDGKAHLLVFYMGYF